MTEQVPLRTGSRHWRPSLIWLPALLALGLVVLYAGTRPLGGEPRPSFYVIGSAVPGVQIGQIAPGSAPAGSSPTLGLVNVAGGSLALADYAGHPIWVIFWKTACEPCEAEAPDVAASLAAHRGDGLIVIGIDLWDSIAVVQDYVAAHSPSYPIGIDPTSHFTDAYGVWGAPTHYFIGADGIIRDRYFGPMTRTLIEKSLLKILD